MTDQVEAQYEAHWYCPKCDCLGDRSDKGVIDNGEYLDVDCYECGHEYEVSL